MYMYMYVCVCACKGGNTYTLVWAIHNRDFDTPNTGWTLKIFPYRKCGLSTSCINWEYELENLWRVYSTAFEHNKKT